MNAMPTIRFCGLIFSRGNESLPERERTGGVACHAASITEEIGH